MNDQKKSRVRILFEPNNTEPQNKTVANPIPPEQEKNEEKRSAVRIVFEQPDKPISEPLVPKGQKKSLIKIVFPVDQLAEETSEKMSSQTTYEKVSVAESKRIKNVTEQIMEPVIQKTPKWAWIPVQATSTTQVVPTVPYTLKDDPDNSVNGMNQQEAPRDKNLPEAILK